MYDDGRDNGVKVKMEIRYGIGSQLGQGRRREDEEEGE